MIIFPATLYAVEDSIENDVDKDIKTVNIDTGKFENRLKAGLMIGYPIGITAGYKYSNFFELNGIVGFNDGLTLGVNGLFTILNLNVSGEIFHLSFGPASYVYFGHKDKSDDYLKLDILCLARIEYDFKQIPLNLFFEVGAGFEMIKLIDLAGSCSVGARYIF